MTAAGRQMDYSDEEAKPLARRDAELLEGIDYYEEDGLFVFTAAFLQKRGYCCERGCRHCPYRQHERFSDGVTDADRIIPS
jgi:hypothetical protein